MRTSEAKELLTRERDRLTALREQAVSALEQEREGGHEELSTYDQHDADLGTNLHDLEVNETLVATLDAELAEVDAAFARVEDGTFGRCEHCGEPLPDERLETVPTARFCVEHQPQHSG